MEESKYYNYIYMFLLKSTHLRKELSRWKESKNN